MKAKYVFSAKPFTTFNNLYIKIVIFSLLGSSLVFTSGCSSNLSANQYLCTKRDYMIANDQPVAYVDGYIDGCSTGKRMAGDTSYAFKKDAARAEIDALYTKGWQDGQLCCRNETLAQRQREMELQAEKDGLIPTSLSVEKERRIMEESKRASTKVDDIWEELKK